MIAPTTLFIAIRRGMGLSSGRVRSRGSILASVTSARPAPWLAVRRSVAWRMLVALLGLVAIPAAGADATPARREGHLRLLYAESLFSQVNRSDALAAIRVWVEALGQRRGFALTVETGFYQSLEEAEARIREGAVAMITCTTAEYLQLSAKGLVEAKFVPGWARTTDDYVLITRRDRNLTSLADLRGKSAVFYRIGSGLGRHWLDATLNARGLGAVNDFFGVTSDSAKVSGVILPVFFGKIDVAVAKRYGWETMKELNPQLEAQLQILTHSPHLPDAVVCLLRKGREYPLREDLMRATLEIADDPHGQQILLLFKTEKMVPFQPEHLDHVRALFHRPADSVLTPEMPASAPAAGGKRGP